MKGIILAGGHGTRLYPATKCMSKQLLPIYDKPMIYYPLCTLMSCNIRDILLIVTPEHKSLYEELLQDGRQLGINIQYVIQAEPKGIAECFLLGENFIGSDDVCVILGDNVFYGRDMRDYYKKATSLNMGCVIYTYKVKDPERYGVVVSNEFGRIMSIEEKPKKPKSNEAIVGFYLFKNSAVQLAKTLKPSPRGELEITDLLNIYKESNELYKVNLSSEFSWLDTGTAESLVEASNFIKIVEDRQSLKVGCIEEMAYAMNFINITQLSEVVSTLPISDYKLYLERIIKNA